MSTSDRELLELAAKAVGGIYDECGAISLDGGIDYVQWEPLDDDGDALRLAFTIARSHQVDFNIHIFGAGVQTGSQMAKNRGSFINEGDLASVRRSIVETAAQIGKDIS